MSKLIFKFILFSVLVILVQSCRREGLGGNNTLIVSLDHHGVPVKGAAVYVRYGAKDFPGAVPSDYDLSSHATSMNDSVHVESLRKGDYFVYAVGFDSIVSSTVSGGKHIFISTKSGKTALKLSLTE